MTKQKINIPQNTKALIFDIDGTLADTMPTHFLAYQKVFEKYDFKFTKELFDSIAGIPIVPQMQMFKDKYNIGNFNLVEIAQQIKEEYLKSVENMKPIEVVFNVLKEYQGKMPIACGTGADKIVATKNLEAIGAIKMIDALVTCDDVENGKPAPDTFQKCAELLQVEPQYCLVFEDGKCGIDAALAAGMMVIDVNEYL